jgi:hypothetical protein
MLGADTRSPGAGEHDFECVVLDVHARAPGFYSAAWRSYYVATNGTVYLLRAPGQRVTLQEQDDLPPDATPAPGIRDDIVLRHLAAAVEALPGFTDRRS